VGADELCIGVVGPRTGRLSRLGDPLLFAVALLAPRLRYVVNGERRYAVRLICRDSRSDPGTARAAVADLVHEHRARIVVTMAGTKVLPAVADSCEELGVPCLSTTFPWQAFVYGRDGEPGVPFRWTYHFAWGLDDIADVFADMWESVGATPTVGCLWNDDLQGRLLRRHGFITRARERGHTVVDPGAYPEPARGFGAHIEDLRRSGAEIITSAATAEDLALFHRQAAGRGLAPRLITCSRWLAYPRPAGTGSLDRARVATIVYWSPRHPFRSSLDATTSAALAEAYEQRTGNQWLQPLGPAHALLEVAAHALATAADPEDHHAVADAIGRTRLSTIAGTLDWTAGPTPNVALLPLVGGQWHPGRRHPHELNIVTNTRLPDVPLDTEVIPTGAG
jgi:branched-chain amino acid transport system substrate-binding protein